MAADDEHRADGSAGMPAAAEATPPATDAVDTVAGAIGGARRLARELIGVVTSSKADKTITVRVDRRVKHPVYGKFVRRSTRLAVHDEHNDCREGDTVAIVETRPISKTKSWRLGAVVERAGA